MPKQNKQAKRQQKATDRLMEPATPKAIRREARSATRAQYRPLVREVKAEKKASNLQQKRIGDYFPQYGQALDESAQRTSAAYTAANNQINSASTSAANYAEQLRQKLVSEDQANAQLRGATYNAEPAQTNVSAQLARINAANVLSGVNASHGATQQAYIADKKAIGSREEIEQHLREAARKRSYNKDLRDIAKDKGAFKVAKKAEIIDRERDFALSKQAANFDRKSTKKSQRLAARSQAETARHNAQSEATAAQNAATSAKNAQTTARNTAHDNKHPSSGSTPSGDKGSGRSVKPAAIKAYISQNATPGEVSTDPSVAVKQILNRWPYLDPKYVRKVVAGYARRPTGAGGPRRG